MEHDEKPRTSQIARCVRLGETPKNIPAVVKFTGPDGTQYLLPVTYRYRSREEIGALLDEIFHQPRPPLDKEGRISSKLLQQQTVQCNGQYLFAIIEDWGLDEPFSLSACIQLANQWPAATTATMNLYRKLITEALLGN